jgi:hypothetical protein
MTQNYANRPLSLPPASIAGSLFPSSLSAREAVAS